MEATPASEMPQGTIRVNFSRSVATLRARPCNVVFRENFTPMAQILFPPHHTPERPPTRSPRMEKAASAAMTAPSRARTKATTSLPSGVLTMG